jgi:anti-sigma factor RsiW
MRCRGARRILLAALDGEIDAGTREVLDRHLAGCAACRVARDETARLHGALGGLPQAAAVPPGLEQAALRRIRAALAEAEADRGWWSLRRAWWLAAPAAAAAVALFVWRQAPPREARVAAPAAVSAPAPERAPTPRSPAAEAPVRVAQSKAPASTAGAAAPPPQVAEALDLYLDLPILENLEKLENYESIRTVDVGDERTEGGRG